MKEVSLKADLCVIGGGLAGMCTAISAARLGVKVVLMQDRPVLGGNASSEIRVCICGAHGENNRETGILEEIVLENMYRNPNMSYSIWDSVLYEMIITLKGLTILGALIFPNLFHLHSVFLIDPYIRRILTTYFLLVEISA